MQGPLNNLSTFASFQTVAMLAELIRLCGLQGSVDTQKIYRE